MKRPKKKAAGPRRRLTAEAAREIILGASEKRLREVGPDGLRLQEIARDVGFSHPTLLHHFGSREALVAAVVERALTTLQTDLIACFQNITPGEMVSTLHQVDDVMRIRGHARLVAWLALTQPPGSVARDSRLGDLARAIHATRTTLGNEAPYEDTAFGVFLVAVAMFGVSIVGPGVFTMLGLPSDEATMTRFREMFASLLMKHAGIQTAAEIPAR